MLHAMSASVPWTFNLAVSAILGLLTTFVSVAIVFLLHKPINRIEQVLHRLPEERYHTQFATPIVTVFVGTIVAGFGVSLMIQEGNTGFVGFLLAILAVFLVARYCYTVVKRTSMREHWPPKDLAPDRPPKIRQALARLEAECDTHDADPTRQESIRRALLALDKVVPKLHARAQRPLRRWLREDHRALAIVFAGYAVCTVGLAIAAAAALVGQGGSWPGVIGLPVVVTVLVVALGYGSAVLTYHRERWQSALLKAEVEERISSLRSSQVRRRLILPPDLTEEFPTK